MQNSWWLQRGVSVLQSSCTVGCGWLSCAETECGSRPPEIENNTKLCLHDKTFMNIQP